MSIKKLETNITQSTIPEEIEVLKSLLDETTHKMVGDQIFKKIQTLVTLSQEANYTQLEKEVTQLSNDEMVFVSRYFSILPLLINISEDVNFAYEINYQNNKSEDYLGKLSLSIDKASQSKKAQEILEHINVVPVLTAHPTQVQRKTILELTSHIHKLLRKYHDVKTGVVNREKWITDLHRYIEIIMQTDIIREKKLKVKNEIENVMVYYNNSLIPAITKLTSEYKRLATEKGLSLTNPKPITMGMWIGGDRDGNPYVTAETLRLSASVQSELILNYYIEKLSKLYRTFSLSTNLSKISPEVEKLAELSSDTSVFRENEPYRKAFNYIQSKLIQTLIELKTGSSLSQRILENSQILNANTFASSKNASVISKYLQTKFSKVSTTLQVEKPSYKTAQEFKNDLLTIKQSLLDNGDSALLTGDFSELLQAIDVFGFFLATIDMRQDSSVNEACVAELLKSANIVENYSELPEREKIKVLLKELTEDPRTLSSTHAEKSELLKKELAIFQTARYLKDKLGDEVIKQHIISHTESVSDMFELAIMLKEVGLLDNQTARIQIVPLFETIKDLENSTAILAEYLDYDIVKKWVSANKD